MTTDLLRTAGPDGVLRTAGPDGVLAAVDDLAHSIAEQAAVTEREREVPAALIDELASAGCFRLIRPASHGGLGADLATALDVWRRLAWSDASTAWTVMIGSAAWLDLAGLSPATFDELFAADREVIVAGAFNPSGTIERHGDGYRVSGRWSFASGCRHATLLYGNCVESTADSSFALRIAAFEPHEVAIEDTWRTLGLRGTGSHHFHVDGLAVAAAWTHDPMAEEPWLDTPVVRVPVPTLAAHAIAAVALGIAEAALDDIVAIASDKVPLLAPAPLASDPTFHQRLAAADTELRAASALLRETAEAVWSTGVEARPFAPELRARARATGNWIVDRAIAAVDFAHHAAGSASVYDGSPLERRLRDIHTLSQHFLVRADATTVAGSVLAGQALELPIF
jgi:alkylation response protein AidB-like acyl-CoA dehydrogenase